jgi:hypothetical protein
MDHKLYFWTEGSIGFAPSLYTIDIKERKTSSEHTDIDVVTTYVGNLDRDKIFDLIKDGYKEVSYKTAWGLGIDV